MDSAKKQLADRIKSANNVLVTVSRDPSIDQLAACLGLTLILNKMNKHSVAVFSGQVPSAIEFLKPEATLEKTTDSLRDFIIALDKDKADKLRYKVEDNVVRIFITPYKTSISQEDLEFSQGDFNVDVVIALGVKQQQDLDESITAHGRILHDATVASLNLSPDGGLGTISWHDPQASSLSELVTDLAALLGDKLLDSQVATALLTGIVAETNRFSNNRTSSQTMNASSVLMSAGANQQLVASKLEEPEKPKPSANKPAGGKAKDSATGQADSNTLDISHHEEEKKETEAPKPKPAPEKPESPEPPAPQLPTPQPPSGTNLQPGAKLMDDQPPSIGGTLNANTKAEGFDPVTDPMSMPQNEQGQLYTSKPTPQPKPTPLPKPVQEPAQPPASDTLSQIEQSVGNPHAEAKSLDTARDEVNQALQGSSGASPSPPIKALNAQPLGDNLHSPGPDGPDQPPPGIQPSNSSILPFDNSPASSDTDPSPKPSDDTLSPSPQISSDPSTAPPVPPPLPSQTIDSANKPPQMPPL